MLAVLFLSCQQDLQSDDPLDYNVDVSVEYEIQLSPVRWVVPSGNLPSEVTPQASNNNVDIHFFENKLYMAWRSSPTHFAGENTDMWIVSSTDMGENWEFETKIHLETDVREPRFFSMNGVLQFSYFEAGSNPLAFEPIRLWRMWHSSDGWSAPESFLPEKTVLWDIKKRNDIGYMTVYDGAHYSSGDVYVRFLSSTDGREWDYVDGVETVYTGGVSEVAFEFDSSGNLWAVGRNEDGDATGAGTQLCYARAGDLANWDCLEESDPERYDSPEMFRHGDDIYVLGRTDVDGSYGPDGDLLAYSFRPKGFALYKINPDTFSVDWIQDLPGVGDTSFPSIQRIDTHRFIFANYTSPLDNPDISWLEAQGSELGTQIYLMELEFTPKD
jgi:hypothetical protein